MDARNSLCYFVCESYTPTPGAFTNIVCLVQPTYAVENTYHLQSVFVVILIHSLFIIQSLSCYPFSLLAPYPRRFSARQANLSSKYVR